MADHVLPPTLAEGGALRTIQWTKTNHLIRYRLFHRKRIFDLCTAAFLLLLTTPLLLAIAAAIKFDSEGPVFFRQTRLGRGKRPFQILKFRSLTNANTDVPVIQQVRRRDPRVTRVGAVLRRFSLDELPQLLNVLRGEMSIVGPRPHAQEHDAAFASLLRDYDARFAVQPGITGLAQVRGLRGEVTRLEQIAARLHCDLTYIHMWSLRLDCKIILASALLMWRDQQAY